MAAGYDEQGDKEGKAWEKMAGESIAWYGRFKLFLSLGPTRSVRQAYLRHLHMQTRTSGTSPSWLDAANRWQWRERADAWDLEQRTLLALADHNVLRAARDRRVAYLEAQLEEVREALRVANIAELDQAQARKSLGVLNSSFEHLVEAIRKEYEKPLEEAHDGGVRITADDLRAAQRELERQEAERAKAAGDVQGGEQGNDSPEGSKAGAGWRGQQSTWPPADPSGGGATGVGLARGAHGRRQRRSGRLLLVCLGAGADDPFDLGVLRTAGLESMRVREVVSAKFSSALRRERGLGRTVELLHVEQPTSTAGIVFPNIQRDGAWLRRQLQGVRILLLAQHTGVEATEWFDAIPYVVTIGVGIDAGTARVFLAHFWQAIAQGRTGSTALEQALAQCPEGTEAFVRGYVGEAVGE